MRAFFLCENDAPPPCAAVVQYGEKPVDVAESTSLAPLLLADEALLQLPGQA
jgi:hypothetical protein